jgi:catechol 2,3-dioxygenase-like lactoylglutathione lyase family enzyme
MAGFTTPAPIRQTVFMHSRLWHLGLAILAASALPAASGPCGAAHADLEFFLGAWDVLDQNGRSAGTSQVAIGMDGCTVTETWQAAGSFGGINVHAYSAEEKRWHALYVDNHGHVHAFVGTAGNDRVEYTGTSRDETGREVLHRMSIARGADRKVDVWWRKSTDNGKTWITAYQAVYRAAHESKTGEHSMLGTHKLVAFAAIRDRDAARKFYRDTLGLRLLGEDQFAMVFDANGTTLRLTPVPDWTPPKFTVLGWDVPDIEAAVTELEAAGVTFERFPWMKDQNAHGIWTSPSGADVARVHAGARVAWFKDPDGNLLSVSQLPKPGAL